MTFIPAFTTNAMTSDFLSLISHGWVVTFQDSHRTVFTYRSWIDLLGVVLAFWISILKISKLLQNCWHRVINITSFEKHLEISLDHNLNLSRNLVIFRSKNICQKESLTRSSPVRTRGLSRECAPPCPQRDRKRRVNGAVCRNHRIKSLVPCPC